MSGNKPYDIEYIDEVVKKDISKLPKKVKSMIRKAIQERLMLDPIGFGKPLMYIA